MGAIPAAERAALIALYNSTNGGGWLENSGWKGNNPEPDGFSEIGSEDSWCGISVNTDHIIGLYFSCNQLTGTIPSEISNLTNLEPYWDMRYLLKKLSNAMTEDDYKSLLPQYLDQSQLAGPANIS